MTVKRTLIGLQNGKGVHINIAEGFVVGDQINVLKDFIEKIAKSNGKKWEVPLLPNGSMYQNNKIIRSDSLVICGEVLNKVFSSNGIKMNVEKFNIINRLTDPKHVLGEWNIILTSGGTLVASTVFKTLDNNFKKLFVSISNTNTRPRIVSDNNTNNTNTNTNNNKGIQQNIPKQNIPHIQTNIETYKVLSYNISWEAMTGLISKMIKIKCQPEGSDSTTKCLSNIKKFIHTEINSNNYDIIGLQEASNWRRMVTDDILKKYNYVASTVKNEDMITLYDKNKLTLDADLGASVVISYMEDVGRPIMILFFNNSLCVINVHAGHHNDILKISEHITKTVSGEKIKYGEINPGYKTSDASSSVTEKPNYNFNEIKRKLKTYNIIILGDMNYDMNSHIRKKTLFNINIDNEPRFLYTDVSTPYVNTCCDETFGLKNIKHKYKNDHILASSKNIKFIQYDRIKIPSPSSDHLPIGAMITFTNRSNQKGGKYLYFKTKTDYLNLK